LCTHQECISAGRLAGEAPFATPKSTHTVCCWGYWALTLRSPFSLGSLDHVVASLQQTSASEPENNQITDADDDCRQDHFMCNRTSQLKMLDCCLHWHRCSVAWLSFGIAQTRQANVM